MLIAILLQAAAPATMPAPDIELQVNVRARSLTIQKQGDASLTVRTDPDGGNVVDVRAPKANGRRTIRNVDVGVRAQANIADTQQNPAEAETSQPERR